MLCVFIFLLLILRIFLSLLVLIAHDGSLIPLLSIILFGGLSDHFFLTFLKELALYLVSSCKFKSFLS